MLPGEGISQKRGLIKKGEPDCIAFRLNLNFFPTLYLFRGQKVRKVSPNKQDLSPLSLFAFPWFLALALCWASLSLQRRCFTETLLKKKNTHTVVPQIMRSPASRHFQCRQATMLAEFSTCCYSSRKNVIPAALLRSKSKSLLLPQRTLTLHCPLSGAETPGRTPAFSWELDDTAWAFA